MDTKVVEQCRISPSDGSAAQQSLPLLYFDMVGLPLHHVQALSFFNIPSLSKPHFFNTILPNLKNSLSLTLKHFLSLAGNIIFPLNSGMPVSHYSSNEDSISLSIAFSDSDFFLLTGNHLMDADDFHDFIPEIPSAVYSPESIKIPVMAVQITLFPNQGICIGVANHHAVCDGATMVCFHQTWASIHKLNDDKHLLALGRKVRPVYDRSAVEDSDKLTPLFWEIMKNSRPAASSSLSFPTHKLRGTFLLRDEEILKLKKAGTAHVSSNTAVCARVWSCLAGSAAAAGERVSDDEAEYLWMPIDCRGKLKPPLPSTYFGNCLTFVLAESTHGRLRGDGGFVAAAEAIEEGLRKSIEDEKGIAGGFIERYVRIVGLHGKGKRMVGVSGSPRFDLASVDYGWGGIKKLHILNIDVSGSLSLCKRMEGVEVGISMSKLKMDAFASLFNKNVHDLPASKL